MTVGLSFLDWKIIENVESVIEHLNVVAIEKGAFWLPSTTVANFTLNKEKKSLKI